MLTDHTRELLTAFLDSELGRRQRKLVLRLLNRSSEARAFLQELQEGAQQLQQLPQKTLPPDFPAKVLHTIAERGLRPAAALPTLPLRRGIPTWARLAMAAAVLAAVGLGSYALYPRMFPPRDMGSPPSEQVASLIGNQVPLTRFKEEKEQRPLTAELKKKPSFQFDLTVSNTAATVKHVESAFKNAGVDVLFDPQAKADLKAERPKASYLLFAENLQPEEAASLLQRLALDIQGNGQPLARLDALSNRQRIADALGVPVDEIAPAPPRDMDLLLPIHDPDGKANPPQTPAAERPQSRAVIVPFSGDLAAARKFPEVQRFLASRQPARAGTVQLVVVVHS